jgi:hypothetical protein
MSRKQVLGWRFVRWGTFAFAVTGLFNLEGSPYFLPGILSAFLAFCSLASGRRSLENSFNLLGLRDPAQALVFLAIGSLYWAISSAGLVTTTFLVKGIVPEFARFGVIVFGVFCFTGGGSLSVFASEPNPCPWR